MPQRWTRQHTITLALVFGGVYPEPSAQPVRQFECGPGLLAPPPCRQNGTMSTYKAAGEHGQHRLIPNLPSCDKLMK
jgi:hypothetical protein